MLNIICTVLGLCCLIFIWVMLYDSNRFEINSYDFKDPRIKKAVRAIVLSDLHNKKYGKKNELLIGEIKKCNPDVILVAGDLLTAKPGKSLEVALDLMRELSSQYPVYYGNGNHEYRMKIYPETYGDMAKRYEMGLKEMGISPLVNDSVFLQETGIAIYGAEIDAVYYRRMHRIPMDETYMEKILGKGDPSTFQILLAHNPEYFKQYARWGADLVLSGHVHGGIVRIPFWKKGVISPSLRLFPKYDGGRFCEGKSTMLISRGLGVHTIPVRLFNPGEILVLDLEPEEESLNLA